MEHYALRLLQPAFPAPEGLRAIVIRDEPAEGGTTLLIHESLLVVGFQPRIVHHYTSDEPRPVQPDPTLMEKLGWHYKHQDCHCAPVCITKDGRLTTLDPAEPCWMLIEPGTPGDRVEQLAEKLREEERIRRTIEHRIEDLDQDGLASD